MSELSTTKLKGRELLSLTLMMEFLYGSYIGEKEENFLLVDG